MSDSRNSRGCTFVLLLSLFSAPGAEIPASEPAALFQVTDPANFSKYVLNRCEIARVNPPDGPALEVKYKPETDWPNIRFDLGKAFQKTDWSSDEILVVTLSNPTLQEFKVNIRVDDGVKADGREHCRQGGCLLPAGKKVQVKMDLASLGIPGMRGQPRNRGVDKSEGAWIKDNARPIDLHHIVAFQLFLARPKEPHTLRIHKIELLSVGAKSIAPFVDRFGQFIDEDWPGKIHKESEFQQRIAEEAKDLEEHAPLADRDRYGGWAKGPQFHATGRFRVQKIQGKWWFVDPEGRLFWSSGVTGLRAESAGPSKGRQHYFSWLPKKGDPLAAFFDKGRGRERLDFFKMNLYRKYGPDFPKIFAGRFVRRMWSWGFNTIGNWSDSATWKLQRLPYTIPVHYRCRRFQVDAKRSFPDVFDPGFEKALADKLKGLAEYKNDPWLLGNFIDNELPWERYGKVTYHLAVSALELPGDWPIKQAAADLLKKKYETIERLNDAWGAAFKSWEELLDPVALDKESHKKAREDLSAIVALIAEKYFSTCRKLMDEFMPGALWLGPRFSRYNREVVTVARKYCDVVCFNIYAELPTEGTRGKLAEELDFPIVIGEYHFGALDRGMFHTGLRKAKDQSERAAKFAKYLKTAAAQPWCVGAHWFQFRDQPLTGRFDGENYNIGFVTITDTPYPEMRQAARETNASLYPLRWGK